MTLSSLILLIGQPLTGLAETTQDSLSEEVTSSVQLDVGPFADLKDKENKERLDEAEVVDTVSTEATISSSQTEPSTSTTSSSESKLEESTNESKPVETPPSSSIAWEAPKEENTNSWEEEPATGLTNVVQEEEQATEIQLSAAMTGKEFVEALGKDAAKIAEKYDLYASVMIAQASLESGFGTSQLARAPHYNLFGIKGAFQGKSVSMGTLEESGSGFYGIQAGFGVYPSYKESMEDYAKLLKNGLSGNSSFYRGTWKSNTGSYRDATKALTGTYATDRQYGQKLNSIIQAYQLERFDKGHFVSEQDIAYKYSYYEVAEGDSLDDIVRSETVTFEQLRQWNPSLKESDEVTQGEKLIISKRQLKRKQISESTTSGFTLPIRGTYTVTSEFGLRNAPTSVSGTDHKGIDLATDMNTKVYASSAGRVEQVGFDSSAGNYVIIKHESGYYTSYFHLNSFNARKGDIVTNQTLIGLVGSTGDSTGAHLHFAISKGIWDSYLNPREYLEFK